MKPTDQENPNQNAADGGGCGDSCGNDYASTRSITVSLAISGGLVGVALLGRHLLPMPPWAVMSTAGAAMIAGGWFLVPKAGRALLRLRPDINLLVVIAAIGASIIGEWVEAAA